MRATATDGVACLFRVSVLATTVNPAKTAEPIDMLFGKKTRGFKEPHGSPNLTRGKTL